MLKNQTLRQGFEKPRGQGSSRNHTNNVREKPWSYYSGNFGHFYIKIAPVLSSDPSRVRSRPSMFSGVGVPPPRPRHTSLTAPCLFFLLSHRKQTEPLRDRYHHGISNHLPTQPHVHHSRLHPRPASRGDTPSPPLTPSHCPLSLHPSPPHPKSHPSLPATWALSAAVGNQVSK